MSEGWWTRTAPVGTASCCGCGNLRPSLGPHEPDFVQGRAGKPVEWLTLGVGDGLDEYVLFVFFERDHEGNRWMAALRISGPSARVPGHAG